MECLKEELLISIGAPWKTDAGCMMMIIVCLCGRTEGAGKNEDPSASEEQAGSGSADGAVRWLKSLRFADNSDGKRHVERWGFCPDVLLSSEQATQWS